MSNPFLVGSVYHSFHEAIYGLVDRVDEVENIEDGLQTWATGVNNRLDTDESAISALESALNGKFNTPNGTTGQYVRGDGTLAAFPSIPSSYTDEMAQDAVGGILSNEFVYNDAANTISLRQKSYTNNPSRSFVTTQAAANGFQVSATRDAKVSYSVTIGTSISLAGNASGYVVLEINETNATSGWQEVGRVTNGQSGALVIGLTLNQVAGGILETTIPAGYYGRLRTVNVSGTPSYTFNSGQEVLL